MAGLSGPDGEHAAPAAVLGRALGERGSTLVELLVATAIMGIAVVAMLVGSSLTFTSSGANRQSTTAGIVARDYAEDLDLAIPSGGGWCSYPSPYVGAPHVHDAGNGLSVANVPGLCPAADPTVPQYQTVTITVNALNGSGRDVDRLSCVSRDRPPGPTTRRVHEVNKVRRSCSRLLFLTRVRGHRRRPPDLCERQLDLDDCAAIESWLTTTTQIGAMQAAIATVRIGATCSNGVVRDAGSILEQPAGDRAARRLLPAVVHDEAAQRRVVGVPELRAAAVRRQSSRS